MKTSQLVIEHLSKFKFEKTVDSLVAEAERREWKVPFIHDLQLSLAKSGQKVKPVKVIEICKPAYSGKMLELNDERIVSVMALAASLQANIAKVMKAASDDTFEIVNKVVG